MVFDPELNPESLLNVAGVDSAAASGEEKAPRPPPPPKPPEPTVVPRPGRGKLVEGETPAPTHTLIQESPKRRG